MGLDIMTDAGKLTLEEEMRAAQIIEAAWYGAEYVMTPKTTTAIVDAMIVRNSHLCAVVETKGRRCTMETLRRTFHNEWLVTFDKIVGCARVAQSLVVEFWGFLYLVPDDTVMRIKLWDPRDGWLPRIRVGRTETQKTVNGGKIVRSNAYIHMSGADVLPRLADDPPIPSSNVVPLHGG